MTLENFNIKKDMVSRYFHRDKWKDEAGVFQYPRGKKRTDAILESLEIVFDKEEFTIEKELTLRGDNVLGNVFVISVVMDDKNAYMALTITDHLFALMMLPDNCIEASSFISKIEVQQENKLEEENNSLNKLNEKKNIEEVDDKFNISKGSDIDEEDKKESIEKEIERAFCKEMPEFPELPEI